MVIETIELAGLFILVFAVMRFLGKTLLSQWTAYDLITIIFLSYAALGAVKIESFIHAVISIIVIGGLYYLLSRLSLNSFLSHFIIGEPTILIKHGKISQENLQKIRYSLSELLSTIRTFGYPDIQDIEYAILEPNGKISVIPMKELQPVTVKHLNIETPYTGLPITIIEEGRIQYKNLQAINKNERWVKDQLLLRGYDKIEKIYYAYKKDNDESITIFPYT